MKENPNYELHNIKNKNNKDRYLNKESIEQMFKTANKYKTYSEWKTYYHFVYEEEGKTI